MERGWLFAAGMLNAGAALLHLACIIGGPGIGFSLYGHLAELGAAGRLTPCGIVDSIRRDNIAGPPWARPMPLFHSVDDPIAPGWLFSPRRWLLPGCFVGCYWLFFDNSQIPHKILLYNQKSWRNFRHNSQRKITAETAGNSQQQHAGH